MSTDYEYLDDEVPDTEANDEAPVVEDDYGPIEEEPADEVPAGGGTEVNAPEPQRGQEQEPSTPEPGWC